MTIYESATKPAAVFVHGAGNSKVVWRSWEEEFAKRGWDCRAINLRGHGDDERDLSRASMNDYANDVAEVLKAASSTGARTMGVGWSMGGADRDDVCKAGTGVRMRMPRSEHAVANSQS
jgi:pimeloyl-ACP methyl ester carboxylesterase